MSCAVVCEWKKSVKEDEVEEKEKGRRWWKGTRKSRRKDEKNSTYEITLAVLHRRRPGAFGRGVLSRRREVISFTSPREKEKKGNGRTLYPLTKSKPHLDNLTNPYAILSDTVFGSR